VVFLLPVLVTDGSWNEVGLLSYNEPSLTTDYITKCCNIVVCVKNMKLVFYKQDVFIYITSLGQTVYQ